MAQKIKKVIKHLKGDIETFKHEASEDRSLIKDLKKHKGSGKKKNKIKKVLKEFKKGELHSGSKKGPKVVNPKQAIAIALSEAKRSKKRKK